MRPALVLLLFAVLALAGCASDTDPSGEADDTTTTTPPTASTPAAPAPVTLSVATSGTYPVDPGFAPATLSAPSGAAVTVEFENADQNPVTMHDWVLEGVDGAAVGAIGGGETASATFTAPAPGEYAYFCSIGDHRARGMEGTLTVTAA